MEALQYVSQGDASGMASIGCVRAAGAGAGSCLITCGAGGSLALRGSEPAAEVSRQVALGVPVHCLAVDPASAHVAVADDSHFVRVCAGPRTCPAQEACCSA